MALTGPAPSARVGHSPHLADLLVEVDALAARLREASDAERTRLGCDRRDLATLATLHLDGSPLQHLPDLEDVPREPLAAAAPATRGTWLDAMRALDDEPDERLQALEVLGTRAGLGSDDLARRLLRDTTAALEELHQRLTHGLVVDERAGRPRQVEQAVHDASTGRVLYFASDPSVIEDELGRLATWMATEADRTHPVVASGVLHLEVLRIHPFDAANGRLARTAARLVLRAGGLDPDGLACPEPELASDALGYYEEVARTSRRRDATIWLERWAEAVATGLRASADALGLDGGTAPERGTRFLASLDGPTFTVADYRDHTGGTTTEIQQELHALVDAGRIRRVPGSRGLRFARRTGPEG